jgi:hypothetical protein
MKILRTWYQPEADVEFTLTDVWALTLFSERHYDYKCRELSMNGGLLRGMRNMFPETPDKDATITYRVDMSTAQLLAKCAEQDPSLLYTLMPVVKLLNDAYLKINAENRKSL